MNLSSIFMGNNLIAMHIKTLFISFMFVTVSNAQNVGIGTTSPLARLHVTDSAVLFTGPAILPISTTFPPPVSGAGTRMMWYPQKAAFRAGYVSNAYWNMDSIGSPSFAIGANTMASGVGTLASGILTIASGYAATSLGYNTLANGYASTSIGSGTSASGDNSTSMGNSTAARGYQSVAMGFSTINRSNNSLVLGFYNDTTNTNQLFAIGNGSTASLRNNALTVLTNGNVGLGSVNPVARLHVKDSAILFEGPLNLPVSTTFPPPASGAGARMMWYPQKAAFRAGLVDGDQWNMDSIGRYSFAAGLNAMAKGIESFASGLGTKASGINSTSMGSVTIASGYASTSLGRITVASGDHSVSMGKGTTASGSSSISLGEGTTASGIYSASMGFGTTAASNASISMGSYTTAKAQNSVVMGVSTINRSTNSLVLGIFNDTTNTNQLFAIGNGTSDNLRKNAVTVITNGNVGIGTINPLRPLSFPNQIGEKILLYPGVTGEVGIGVYGNELRIHADNPGAKVSFGTQDNAGNFTENARAERNGAYSFFVNGSLWVNGTTYASDERFKQNVTSINSPLQKLQQLKGVEYEMKTDAFTKKNFHPGRQMGLIAQDVEKVVPEAVNELDGYKGVDYARLVPLLIEGMKAQQKLIEQQQQELEALKSIVNQIKK